MKLTSKNLYSYCDNKPVSKTDLNGEIAIAAIAIGAGLNVLSSWIVAEASGEKLSALDVAVAAVSGGAGAFKYGFLASVVIDCVYEAFTEQDTSFVSNCIEALIFEGLSIPGMFAISGIEKDMDKALMYLLEFSLGTSTEVIDVTYGYNSLTNIEESSAISTKKSSEIVYKRMAGEWFPIR